MQDLEIYEHLVSSQAAVSLRTASRLTGPKWWRNFKGWDASPVSCAFVLQQLTYMWLQKKRGNKWCGRLTHSWRAGEWRDTWQPCVIERRKLWGKVRHAGVDTLRSRIMNHQSYKRFFLCTFSLLHRTAAPQLRFPNKSQRLTRTRLKLETWV